VLSNKNNKLMIYIYSQKHNYIHYSTLTINKVQLHVSAINVGDLQVEHEALNDKLYLHVSGGFIFLWDGVGARSGFVFVEGVWIGSAIHTPSTNTKRNLTSTPSHKNANPHSHIDIAFR